MRKTFILALVLTASIRSGLFEVIVRSAETGGVEHGVAEAVIAKGGSVSLLVNGKRSPPIRDAATLPPGPIRINEVDLRNSKAVDSDMAVVARVKGLERLLIIGRPITDAGIAQLAGLRELNVLEMAETKTTDAAVRSIVELKKLRGFSLDSTKITDASLDVAAQLPELAVLKLGSTAVTDAGLAKIVGLKKLDILQLNNTNVSDAGMVHVGKMTSLRQLRVSGTLVGDASVAHIANLNRLTSLSLVGCAITSTGHEALQRALPACKIDWRADLVRTNAPLAGAVAGIQVEGGRAFQPTKIENSCRGPIPSFLQRATIYGYAPTGLSGTADLGETRVKVDRELGLYMAVSWQKETNKEPELPAPLILEHDAEKLGWQLVGALNFRNPGLEPHLVFWKKFQAGETAVLRTRRLGPPMIIVAEDAGYDPTTLVDASVLANTGKLVDSPTELHPSLAELLLRSKFERLLRTQAYPELESLIAELRNRKLRNKNGRALLGVFYDATVATGATQQDWEAEQTLFDRWVESYPKSAAAQISLSRFWLGYAYYARGFDKSRPEEERYRLYEERIAKAEKILHAAYDLDEKDPFLCRADVHLAIERHYTPEQLETIIKRSLAIDPYYTATLTDACRYYFINNFGQRGDLEKFTDRLVELTRATYGEQLYGEVMCYMVDIADSRLFVSFKFDWDRSQAGLKLIEERFPQSARYAADIVKLWGHRGDRAKTQEALARLDALGYPPFEFDADVDRWRRWAQDDHFAGDQKAIFTDIRSPILRLDWTVDGKNWIALDNHSTLTVIRAADRKLISRTGHSMFAARFSAVIPFADSAVSAGWSGTIMFYPPRNQPARIIGRHEGVTSAALSTDGSEWATSGPDKTIRYWNLDKPEEPPHVWDMAPLEVTALAYVPDSRTIAVGDRDNRVGFWNLDTKKKSVELTPRRGDIEFLRVSGDGEILAVVDLREITLWRIKRFELLATIPVPRGAITDIALSPGGKLLAMSTGDMTTKLDCNVYVWNTADGALKKTFRGHKDLVRAVCFSPDGTELASSADDMTIRLWSLD